MAQRRRKTLLESFNETKVDEVSTSRRNLLSGQKKRTIDSAPAEAKKADEPIDFTPSKTGGVGDAPAPSKASSQSKSKFKLDFLPIGFGEGSGQAVDAEGNPRDFGFDINSFNEQVRSAFEAGDLIGAEAQDLSERASQLPFESVSFEAGIQELRAGLDQARRGEGSFAGTKRALSAARERARAAPGRKQTFLGGR